MKLGKLLAGTLLGLCGIILPMAAQADSVLYDGSGFLVGTQSFVRSFDLASAGKLTVTLANVDWPQQLASLNLLVTSTGGAMGPEMSVGTATFNVNKGDVFAHWFGTAQGPLNAGVYSVKVDFQPAGGTSVPLPTSLALLLSGLGLLLWQRRSKAWTTGQLRLAGSANPSHS